MRVFLDTNVLVSAVATRGICAELLHLVVAEHQLVLGESVLTELSRVLTKKLRLPASLLLETEQFFRAQGEIVATAGRSLINTRDPADDLILAEAIAGKADVLVTGDSDLLVVGARVPFPILTPRAFWELLRAGGEGAD